MSPLEKEWYIAAPWGRIAVTAWGDCQKPPVLLCHGGVDSAISFRPLVQLLPHDYYYIGIDLPGNGKSDWFPPGLMINVYDLVYAVHAVVQHFRWETFVYVGHSMGANLGKIYNLSYPGKISKLIELDPVNFRGIPPQDFPEWYKKYYVAYYENYEKFNTPKEKLPKIKYKEALEKLKKNREINDELAAPILERLSEPAGDGFIRYTFDPRNKLISGPPFSPEHLKKIITSVKTPILNIIAGISLRNFLYGNTEFLLDESIYPAGNFKKRVVSGHHNVHVSNPEKVAPIISQYLWKGAEGLDTKAKL